jgi:hypothetical protein
LPRPVPMQKMKGRALQGGRERYFRPGNFLLSCHTPSVSSYLAGDKLQDRKAGPHREASPEEKPHL